MRLLLTTVLLICYAQLATHDAAHGLWTTGAAHSHSGHSNPFMPDHGHDVQAQAEAHGHSHDSHHEHHDSDHHSSSEEDHNEEHDHQLYEHHHLPLTALVPQTNNFELPTPSVVYVVALPSDILETRTSSEPLVPLHFPQRCPTYLQNLTLRL